MTIFISHPNPVPVFYDLIAMHLCDEFWETTRLRYNRKSATHRFMVGTEWVKMPISADPKGKYLHEIKLDIDDKYLFDLRQKLQNHYGKLTYFDHYVEEVLAVFEESVSQKNNLLAASTHFSTALFKLLEWPLKKPNQDISLTLNNQEDASSVDLGLHLEPILEDDLFTVMHPFQSKSYQRQSEIAITLLDEIINNFETISGVKHNQNLFYLLFKWGGYHFNWSKALF